MTTLNSQIYILKGIDIIDGGLSLNDNPLKIGDWSISVSEDGHNLLIKKDNNIQAKISCATDIPSKPENDRFFMIDPINVDDCIGMLVSNTNRYYNFDFTQAPTLTHSLPTIQLSKKDHDPSILGVITGCEKFSREYGQGVFKTVYSQEDRTNRVTVTTSGIGSMWITDQNGTLNNGDFITSSSIPGYGMKQVDCDVYKNYTWGKITQDCDFTPELKILQKPVDFNRDGPIYEMLTNSEGDPITNFEYEIKYVDINGNDVSKLDYEEDIQGIINTEFEDYDETKSNDNNQKSDSEREWRIVREKALLNTNRQIFRACLIGYQR